MYKTLLISKTNKNMIKEGVVVKGITSLISLFFAIFYVYKNRYRILNFIMKLDFLRKYAVRISMNIPRLRYKLLPSIFDMESE